MFTTPEKTERAIDNCPSHTRRIFNIYEFPKVAEWATDEINKLRPDAIVACGHSGLLLAGAVALTTRVPVFAVRKPGEHTVACSGPVSGIAPHGKAKRWVWLDDFISSGSTLRYSAAKVFGAGLVKEPFPVALLCYQAYKGEFSKWDIDRIVDEIGGYNGFIPSSIPRIGYLKP